MNKTLAIACLALFLASANADNCLTNADCNERGGECCSFFNTAGAFYTQFDCVRHVNGTASTVLGTQTCL